MTANNAHDGELERKLAAHFAAGNGNVPPTPDLWAALHDRLGEQKPRPLWARIRDWRTAMGRFRGTLTLATTAATVVVIAIAGAVWLAGGGFGPGGVVEVRYVEGPPGPAGPAGAQGARGAQGAAGAKGAAGAAGQTMVVEKEKPVVVEKVVTVEKLVEKPVVITKAVERVVEKPVVVQEKVVTVEKAVAAPTRVPASAPTQPAAVEKKVAPSRPAPTRPVGQPGTTTFQDTARQPLTATRDDAVSTFSLDTDRTSFQLALNWARAGHRVDPKSVRAEEWVNAFDYGYAAPRASDRFAITSALFAHPLDRGKYMARVAFQAPDVVTTAPLNVTLVLDASGSMREGNRVAIARAAAEAIRRSLDRDDRMAVVHFTTSVLDQFTVEAARPDDRAVANSIAQLAPHNSTNVQAGLNLGVRLADRLRRERPQALNYVILMSDGVANVDATDPFAILEATSAPSGANPLRLITVGVGIANYNDLLLEQLAQHGDGWYRYLFDVEQARATFRRENWLALASPIADQTRAQVVWNPEAVRAWRIVGYENRVTSAEAFTQDRQEFAEVYAGAATTVFYELELHDDFRQQGGLGQVELRWVAPESGRAWSQSSDLVSSGEVVRLQDHPLLEFGAVVALTADRYSALGDGSVTEDGIARELWSLRDRTVDLQPDLGQLAAFKDFAYVLETLLMHVPRVARDDSGYSR